MGGIITGIRKEIEEDKENEEKINSEAIQLRKVILDKESWKIVTAYNGKGVLEIIKNIKASISEKTKEIL